MTRTEHVTQFKLEEADGQPITCTALIRGVEAHCKELLNGECFCDVSSWTQTNQNRRLPAKWRSLIAFAVDGDSEGYYVHIGVMVSFSTGTDGRPGLYIDCGFSKQWSAEDAQKLATEAQRFLSAARWN